MNQDSATRTADASTARSFRGEEHASLCDALDRVLDTGAVVVGDISISVADVDLLYLSLQLVLTSVEKAEQMRVAVEAREPVPAGGET